MVLLCEQQGQRHCAWPLLYSPTPLSSQVATCSSLLGATAERGDEVKLNARLRVLRLEVPKQRHADRRTVSNCLLTARLVQMVYQVCRHLPLHQLESRPADTFVLTQWQKVHFPLSLSTAAPASFSCYLVQLHSWICRVCAVEPYNKRVAAANQRRCDSSSSTSSSGSSACDRLVL